VSQGRARDASTGPIIWREVSGGDRLDFRDAMQTGRPAAESGEFVRSARFLFALITGTNPNFRKDTVELGRTLDQRASAVRSRCFRRQT